MEVRASYLVVGGFVLAFVAATFGFIVWLAKVDIETATVPYKVYFTGSVTGLNVGSPVRYRGIPVGEVTRIRINPDNVEEIEVALELSDTTPIREDTVASLESQGITGVSYIQLSGGTKGSPPLEPPEGEQVAVIKSEASTLEKVFESAPELLDQLNTLVARATLLLSDRNLASVTDTLSNLKTVTGAVAERGRDIEDTIGAFNDAAQSFRKLAQELRGHGSRITVEAVGTMKSARGVIEKTGKQVEAVRKSADRTLAGANTFLQHTGAELRAARQSMETTLAAAESFLKDTGGEIETVAKSADATMASARTFMDTTGGEIASTGESARRLMDDTDKLMLEEVGPTADKLRVAAAAFDGLARELKGMIGENRRPIADFTNTGLYEFTRFLVEAQTMAEGITRLVGKIEQDPSRFFFGSQRAGFPSQ